ncbi:hypothetical protein CKM354_001281200 [Cercospora kikuchii]|uniref:Uncharacterized protein n=1 Tax=Cercospora kikuchii TaxID=84275 RepID=A0A9P3FMV9_9PEZI|nr:uncharacterized protein CKM354_001281200 [Cercospora kikuchii]GIZ49785.1 hypothetical protein CKM354_001281200 [Cercospora kikuchii]
MSFSSHFEKKANEEMMHEDGQPGRAPAEMEDADMALKKNGYPSSQHDEQEKKDYPPRFSTLFGVAPPAPPPPPPHTPREYVREHYPEPKRRSGIHMPLALFIVLMITLFFESTIIFAYTIIGLYNNAPARLFPWAGQGTAVAATCGGSGQQQPAINIAPNFVIPGQAGAEQQHVTTELITITATPSIPSTSSTSTSTSTTNASSQAAALASDIAGILGSLGLGGASSTTSSSIAFVTVKPPQSTVTSVTVITETPLGPTLTQTTFVDAPKASLTTSQEEIIIRPTTLSSSS